MTARAALLASLLALCACEVEPRAEAPDAARVDDDAAEPIDPRSCTDCHASVTHEWRVSAHHGAFTNDIFQNEWILHRDPWCVRCHAPETDAHDPSGETAAAGVSCTSCHVVNGEIVSTHASVTAPHAVRADATFGTEAQCARCHSVKFPPSMQFHGASVAPGQVLQRTVTEWRASGASGTCQSCHMASVASAATHASHLFPGGRDEALLAHALRVTATARCEAGSTRVHVVLASDHVGHAVPTGDVFRRLDVHATLAEQTRSLSGERGLHVVERDVTRETASLTRRFAVGPDHLLRETRDDRVPAGGSREVDLELRGCGRHVTWQVDWLALDADVADQRGLPDSDIRRTVARGDVAVQR